MKSVGAEQRSCHSQYISLSFETRIESKESIVPSVPLLCSFIVTTLSKSMGNTGMIDPCTVHIE